MSNPYGALGEKNFLKFTLGSILSMIGRQMLTVAVGWEIYERTAQPITLGYVGLAQFLPVLLLTLHAGHVVDTRDRRKVLILSQWIHAVAALALFLLSFFHGPVWAMYLALALAGVGRAFNSPANAALLPQIVSEANFTNAVTWGGIVFQFAAIIGPVLGGLLIDRLQGASIVYLLDAFCCLGFIAVLMLVKSRATVRPPDKGMSFKTLISGLAFVRRTQIILAALTLDMFAVMFGGAVALLPVYAKDILHVGADGLGWLQMAQALGAVLMGFVLTRMPPFRQSGKWLLAAVVGFGVATIGFGLSRVFWLSFLMLFLTGAFDSVSMVIRQSLVQLRTPDEMRGRVSAINYVFIGTSNELGGFESGLVAHWMGSVFSVVSGGVATIATVALCALVWPELRALDRLEKDRPEGDLAEKNSDEESEDPPASSPYEIA